MEMSPQFELQQLILEVESFSKKDRECAQRPADSDLNDQLQYDLFKVLSLMDLCTELVVDSHLGNIEENQRLKAFQFALNRSKKSVIITVSNSANLRWKKLHANSKSKKTTFNYYNRYLSEQEIKITLDNALKIIEKLFSQIEK